MVKIDIKVKNNYVETAEFFDIHCYSGYRS